MHHTIDLASLLLHQPLQDDHMEIYLVIQWSIWKYIQWSNGSCCSTWTWPLIEFFYTIFYIQCSIFMIYVQCLMIYVSWFICNILVSTLYSISIFYFQYLRFYIQCDAQCSIFIILFLMFHVQCIFYIQWSISHVLDLCSMI